MNESPEELLTLGIAEMRERYKSRSKEIITPFPIDVEMEGVTFTVPQRGDKKKTAGTLYPQRKTIQTGPAQTGRETQSGTEKRTADERNTASHAP